MIAIDTNILVRYLVRDDPDQAGRARKLLQETLSADEPGLVTIATLVELGSMSRRPTEDSRLPPVASEMPQPRVRLRVALRPGGGRLRCRPQRACCVVSAAVC